MDWKEENIDDTIKEMGNLVTLIYDYAKHWRLDNFNNINAFLRDNVDNEELSPRERNTILTLSTNYPDGQVLRFFTNRADLQCVVGKNPHKKRFTLIFRGSEGFWDWVYDMCVFKVKLGDYGMKVHSGFYNQLMYNHTFEEIRQYIINYSNEYQYRDWEWVVSGHSLGGALSVLAGYLLASYITYFKWTVISFASPKVGNKVFRDNFELCQNLRHYRVSNNYDLVTSLPTFWYYHTGYNLWYCKEDGVWKRYGYKKPPYSYYFYNFYNPYDHSCDRYLESLQKL
tara:strand:+ start:2252 stop:3103 length:852 start_codon:yes stop_codon:yes gene_type:complete